MTLVGMIRSRGSEMKSRLDTDIEKIVTENGIQDVIAALARYCNDKGMHPIFRRLNKIYEWLVR